MKQLPVHERFYTWQGEGVHMGKPAFFVRLFGCPVMCPWCDSAGTWHKDYVPKHIERMFPEQLLLEVQAVRAPIIVVTGGEPAIHDLRPFTDLVRNQDGPFRIERLHVETSGAYQLQGHFDWVTVSPKRWKLPLDFMLTLADEFKFIIEAPDDIEFYWDLVRAVANPRTPIWLHPEWSQRNNPAVLQAISNAVLEQKGPFRAGWQLHKLYQVDAMDPRSRPLVPLGGDPARGF